MAEALAGHWQADPDDESSADWEVTVDPADMSISLVSQEWLDADSARDIAHALLNAVSLVDRMWPN